MPISINSTLVFSLEGDGSIKDTFFFLLWLDPPLMISLIFSPDNRVHIKDLSYLNDYVVIIRMLSLLRWGLIRGNSYN